MKLEKIDKQTYRSHLNKIIVACIIALVSLSLGSSTLAIALLNDGEQSHFWLNLSGVVFAAVCIFIALNKLRYKAYFYEVNYVWELKQQLNLITRKYKKIKLASEQGDKVALNILHFNYQACKQLYLLDDNTITMTELNKKIADLESQCQDMNIELDINDFNKEHLSNY